MASSLILLLLISVCAAVNGAFLECVSDHSGFQAGIFAPDSPGYISHLLSATQNGRWLNITSERPAFIVVPLLQRHVRPIIICGKQSGLEVRAKSGGHDYEGLSFRSKTPFVMLDLVNLTSIDIDATEKTAWIETGVTLGRLYYEISKKSSTLAFPGGLYNTVGSGGHISGGGIGTLLRKYGLAADNVVDARLMDVKGKILDRKGMGEDVFWAIRGGGGASFGVILAWKLKLVPVPEQVTSFKFTYQLDPENLSLLQKWQNISPKLPAELFIRSLFRVTNQTTVHVTFQGLFLGRAEQLVPQLNKFFPEFNLNIADCFKGPNGFCVQSPWIGSVFFFMFQPTDKAPETLLLGYNNTYSMLQKATSDFLQMPIPNQGWKMIIRMLLSESKYQRLLILDPFGGKMNEIGESETPFPHRNGTLFSIQYLTNWFVNTEEEEKKNVNWMRELYGKMEPYVPRSPRPAYLNYKDLGLGQNDQSCSYKNAKVWGEKYFKGNFKRLARVKGRVDPENYFRSEQSIPVLL